MSARPGEGRGTLLVGSYFQCVVCQMTAVCHADIREAQGVEMHAAAVQKSQLFAAIAINVESFRCSFGGVVRARDRGYLSGSDAQSEAGLAIERQEHGVKKNLGVEEIQGATEGRLSRVGHSCEIAANTGRCNKTCG